ncbi:MAG: hypothetical protein LBV60_08175 [Streptomyces sp.]|nr:hypothetical protein [Streptomyces sp.]
MELRRLPGLYEECADRLSAPHAEQLRERTSGGPTPGMPFNSGAADVRSSILQVLGSWAALVVDERGIAAPRREVPLLGDLLSRHADWLAAHTAAGEISQEIAQLTRRARWVTDPQTLRQVPVGDCVESDCGGSLTAEVRPERPELPAEIRCDRDAAHRWFGHQWLQLARRIAGAAAPGRQAAAPRAEQVHWVTARDVARLWEIPPGSVYRHASVQKWRRRNLAGRTYYHGSDVHETLSRREASLAGH